jgi:hypothetical protein
MKVCTCCSIKKDLNKFHRAAKYKDGRRQKCKECRKQNNYGNNPEYQKKWYKENKERILQDRQGYYEENKIAIKKNVTERYHRIKHTHKYKMNNRRYVNERKKHIKLRTPAWSDLYKIKQIYENCPEGYQVDHIIPLRGKYVSGLHVPENLQYLTPSENYSKNNKYEVNL